MSTTKEKIEIMQAYIDGIPVQHQSSGRWGILSENRNPSWYWASFNYRIKPPEPKVIYVNEYKNTSAFVHNTYVHTTKDDALRYANNSNVVRKAVKYQEVIEE
jgi:hypothetical protein